MHTYLNYYTLSLSLSLRGLGPFTSTTPQPITRLCTCISEIRTLRLSQVWYLFVILYNTLLYYHKLFFNYFQSPIYSVSFVSRYICTCGRYICTCGTYIIFLYIKVSKCIYSMMWLKLLKIL